MGALEGFGWREGTGSLFQQMEFSRLIVILLLRKNSHSLTGSGRLSHAAGAAHTGPTQRSFSSYVKEHPYSSSVMLTHTSTRTHYTKFQSSAMACAHHRGEASLQTTPLVDVGGGNRILAPIRHSLGREEPGLTIPPSRSVCQGGSGRCLRQPQGSEGLAGLNPRPHQGLSGGDPYYIETSGCGKQFWIVP